MLWGIKSGVSISKRKMKEHRVFINEESITIVSENNTISNLGEWYNIKLNDRNRTLRI